MSRRIACAVVVLLVTVAIAACKRPKGDPVAEKPFDSETLVRDVKLAGFPSGRWFMLFSAKTRAEVDVWQLTQSTVSGVCIVGFRMRSAAVYAFATFSGSADCASNAPKKRDMSSGEATVGVALPLRMNEESAAGAVRRVRAGARPRRQA